MTANGQNGRTDGLPIGEAARLLGTSVPALRKRLQRGNVPAYKLDGQWRIIVQAPPFVGGDLAGPQDATIGEAIDQAALIAHQAEEIAFLRGLVADLTRRLPELAAPPSGGGMATGGEAGTPASNLQPVKIQRPWWRPAWLFG